MAKQLNVDLNFRANTTQAQQQISALQASLTKLGYSNALNINDASIQKASAAARELQLHLNRAINVETGKLDLSKFNASLTSANKNLTSLTKDLASGGELGQKAFKNITQAIADAEQPAISLNKQMTTLWTTMKNTLRWQISSSVLSQMMSTVQNAYSYVQKLDKSLNDIRIVSGLSADEMADFAERANEAAKALSTTTTKYADAALIFYQQGLSDKEVEERTNATIKMANVTGEAVDDVSSYMTAVWNNFNKDGTQSVEHFGDVMTKLGADTAASTEEIAGGLEKFAAVADTIGLSFEYATSAITTIVDRTRQSEDVVGTALKTIFSRIQGLKQGETLDDGTDLNQYSEALANVGINIKDANDELRDMDGILDDIGERWDSLDRANKVALAQKVAGIRQYTQFMALFDNWEFMEQNLDIAYNADGTLEEQSEIYAESWEAARNRVKASAQEIYSALIDKDFFIEFDNALADMLTGVADFIENIGGVKSVLIGIGTVFMALIKDKITPGLQSVKKNWMILTGSMDKVYADIQKKNAQRVEAEISTGNYNRLQETELRNTALLSTAKQKLALTARHLSTEEEAAANIAIEGLKYQQNELLETTAKVEQLQKATKASQNAYKNATSRTNLNSFASLEQQMSNRKEAKINEKNPSVVSNVYGFGAKTVQDLGASIRSSLNIDYSSQKAAYDNFVQAKITNDEKIINSTYNVENTFKNTNTVLDSFITKLEGKLSSGHAGAHDYFTNFGKDYKMLESTMNASLKSFPNVIMEMEEVQEAKERLNNTFNTAIVPNQKNTAAIINSYKDLLNVIRQVELSGEDLGTILEQSGSLPAGSLSRLLEQLIKIDEIEQDIETQTDSINQFVNDLDFSHIVDGGEAFGSLMQAAGSAAIAFSSVKSVLDTIGDEDSSGIEKATSILMSISMLGPSIMSIGSAGKNAYQWLSNLSKIYGAINALKEEEKVINAAITSGEIAENTVRGIGTKISEQEIADGFTYNTLYKEGMALRELTNLGLEEEAARRIAVAIAAGDQAKAVQLADQAGLSGIVGGSKIDKIKDKIKGLKTSFMVALPYVLAIGAAIAVAAGVAFLWYQHTHKARKELEESNKTLAEVKSAYDEVNSSIETVKTTLDGLSDKYKNLKELTYGTSEWRDALNDVNDEIQDIIDKYDLTKGEDWYRDDQGVLHITKQGRTEIETENERKGQSARIAYEAAKGYNEEAQVAAGVEEIQYKSTYTGKYKTGYTGGNRKGGQVAYTNQNLSQEAAQTVINAIVKDGQITDSSQIDEEWIRQNTNLSNINQQIVTSNDKLKDKLIELADAVQDNTEAQIQRNANLLAGDKDFSGAIDKYIDDDYKSSIYDIAGEDLERIVEARVQDRKENPTAEGNYITAQDRENYYNDLDYGKSSDGKYYKKNEDGSLDTTAEMSEDMQSDEEIFRWKVKKEAIAEANEKVEDYYTTVVENSKKVWSAIDNTKGIKSALKKAGKELDSFVNKHRDDFENIFIDPQADNTIKEAFKNLDDGALADFIKENETLFNKAMSGDGEAVEELRDRLQDVMATDWREELADSLGDGGNVTLETKAEIDGEIQTIELDPDQYQTTADELNSLLDDLDAAIDPIEVGASLDTTEVNEALTKLVEKTGMSSEEIEKYLSLNGFEGVEITPIYDTVSVLKWSWKEFGFRSVEEQVFSGWKIGGTRAANDIATEDNDNNEDGYGGTIGEDGSDSKPTKKDTKDYKQLSEIKERYHDVNRELERQETLLDKLSKQTDNTYGVAKLQSYTRELKAINKQITIQNKKLAEAQKWQKKDLAKLTNDLHKTAEGNYTGLGLNVKTDKATGEITNYASVMKKIDSDMDAATKKYNDYIKKYNAMSKDAQENAEDTLEKQEKAYEKAEALYDARVEAVKQYEETLDTVNEIIEAVEEARQEWLSKNFEKITYKVEYKLEINEADIALIEHSFDKISEQTYKRAEAIGLIWSSLGKGDEISKTAEKIAVYQDEYKELTDAYNKGQISQADFISGMADLRDGALETAEAIKELDDQMLEYYSDTLSMVSEEIAKYTDGIDSVSSSLEHYLSIMDLLGKSKEYEQINEINNALSKTAKSKFDVATKAYTMYETQQETAKKSLDDYKKTFKGTYEELMNDAQYQALAKNYDAITEKVREAYDEQLTAAEDYFSTLKTIYENEIDQMTEKLLDAFTNGIGMEALQDNMSKISTRWSEYLTPVNQAYELSKLQRQVNQDIEKTSNAAAKKRYKEYSDEIDQLKDKTELSNLELEIAQAKYKQLQAQIALEEAQNAKSTVRLSRDSEGNYGYVYTADKDAIADAEQALDDAENDLYNIALEARNNYGQKVVELEQEMMEKLAEAEKKYVDDKEALEARKKEIVEYYGNLMTTYSNLFRIAGETDARAIDDAWVHTYDSIIKKGENWKDDTTKQTTAATTAWTKYSEATSAIYKQLSLDSDSYKKKVSELVTQEEELATEATTKTIPTLEKMATAVLSTATAYAAARESVLAYITALEGLAEKSQTDIAKAAGTETVDATAYNNWVTMMAAKKSASTGKTVYTNTDQYNVMHFSSSESDLTKYIQNANKKGTPDASVIAWNNSVAAQMMSKSGYFAFDSSGKLHYTTNTDKDKAKEFFEKLGISNATIQKFATGGYTGTWGQSGKLAMLHEKELVLNADDTKNFLAGINILRDVVQAIDLQAMYASNSNIAASSVTTSKQSLAQDITIHAEFPNAVNHTEIELAFDSLANRAAQYVNRK